MTTARDKRREQDRQRLEDAVRQLWTSDGWKLWTQTRRAFCTYSWSNQLLIAMQRPDASMVAGLRTWNRLGRRVIKGQRGIRILAPRTYRRSETDPETGETAERKHTYFTSVSVFDIDQTEGEPVEVPGGAIEGDTHEAYIERLVAYAEGLGYSVDFRPIAGGVGGWCDYTSNEIVVDSSGSPNDQLATLVHETVHALGISSEKHGQKTAEVLTEATAHVVCAGLGLAIDDRSAAYLAGWAEAEGLGAMREHAKLIDETAGKIEDALLGAGDSGDVERRELVAA